MIRPRWDSPVIRRAIDLGMNKSHLKTAIINKIKVSQSDKYLYLTGSANEISLLNCPSLDIGKFTPSLIL